jgi:hypothetical protein
MTTSLCPVSGTGYKAFLNRRLNSLAQAIIGRAGDTACRREWDHTEGTMKNPLDSLWGTVIAGVVLTAVLYAIARIAMGA